MIQRISDEALIPPDPNNRDYQLYLQWVAEGNTAEVAPPVIQASKSITVNAIRAVSKWIKP